MGEHPNELLWYRQQSGTLSLWEKGRFHGHLLTCATCRTRRQASVVEREQLESSGAWAPLPLTGHGHPAAARGGRGGGGARARVPRWAPWALSAAAVGLLLVLALPPASEGDDALRAKGGSLFEVLQASPDGQAQPLGRRCAPGQLLQARYRAAHPWLMVVNVDGAGKAAVMFPYGGASSARTVPGEATLLPISFTLDATPGTERFVALFSEQPLPADAALAAARAPAPQVKGAQVVVVECEKAQE